MDFLSDMLTTMPWPLSVRPDLENLADPETRRLVATALMQLGLGVMLLSISVVVRRGRIVAVLAALPERPGTRTRFARGRALSAFD